MLTGGRPGACLAWMLLQLHIHKVVRPHIYYSMDYYLGAGSGRGRLLRPSTCPRAGPAPERGETQEVRADTPNGLGQVPDASLDPRAKGEWSTIFHVYKAPTLHLFGN